MSDSGTELGEIADTTLPTDLGGKLGLYAAQVVPEYRVADVKNRILHQLWEPVDGDYGRT